MSILKSKIAVSPVIVTALFLVVAVVSVVGFSGWFSEFSSSVFVDVEKDSSNSNSLRVEGIFDDKLYLFSNNKNVDIDSLKVFSNNGSVICEFSTVDLSNSGLVGHWRLDDDSSIIKDYSGNGHDGELYGSSKLLLNFDNGSAYDKTIFENDGMSYGANCSSLGIYGNGCTFDGVDDYISVNPNSLINLTEFSVSIWFKTDYVPVNVHNNIIFSVHDILGENIFRLGTGVNGGIFSKIYTTGPYLEYGDGYNEDNWHNLIFTYNGSEEKIYVDSNLIHINNNISVAIDFTQISNVSIGQEFDAGTPITKTDFFRGSLDETGIYSKVLDINEVKKLYDSKRADFIEFVDSKKDTGINFNGINSKNYIDLGNNSDLNPNIFSIVSITKPKSLNNYNYIYSNSRDYSNGIDLYSGIDFKLRFTLNNFRNVFKIWNNSNTYDSISLINEKSILSDYIFSVVTYDGVDVISTFINGEYLSSSGNNIRVGQPATFNSYIGTMGHKNGKYTFDGVIDDLKLFNRNLSLGEIEILYSDFILAMKENNLKIDLSVCDLNKNDGYNVLGFSDLGEKFDVEIIAK